MPDSTRKCCSAPSANSWAVDRRALVRRRGRRALLFPDAAPHCRHLDDWLTHFGITVYARHGALADAYATAELWLVLLAAAQRNNLTTAHQLRGLLRARRWLSAH
jgi:DNA polymerase III epsilon subunit-like protein